MTGQRKKAKANCAALWQMHLSAASPFSLDWDMELQAVPFGQRFQTVPPKSDASALIEMAKKKGERREKEVFSLEPDTALCNYQSLLQIQEVRRDN